MKKIILASTSPRRKEILAKLDLPFEIQESSYEEDMTLDMSPEKLAEHLSAGKARAVAERNTGAVVIAADTFIVHEHQRLGKPITPERAKEMLNMLSGKEHEVVTGITIIDTDTNKQHSFHQTTKITMSDLPPRTIDNYIKTGEPLNRAGAYAVQEKGSLLIEKIDGDFFNVMGLPIKRLAEELKHFGVYAPVLKSENE